jgi:hypothetical protein
MSSILRHSIGLIPVAATVAWLVAAFGSAPVPAALFILVARAMIPGVRSLGIAIAHALDEIA